MKLRNNSSKKIMMVTNSIINLPKIQRRASEIKTSNEMMRKQKKQSFSRQKMQRNEIKTKNMIKNKRSYSLVQQIQLNVLDIGAQAYGVYNQNLQPLIQFNVLQKRQIASLTKMMTLLTALKLSERFNVQIKITYFRVSVNASIVSGTSAELDPKEWVTVEDLLYGLMLPSGNDAAMALAQNFGAYLYYQRQGQSKTLTEIKSLDITNDGGSLLKTYCEMFVKQMNIMARQFEMNDTLFMNPHGLDCKQAYSTVQDLSILSKKVNENQIGFKIISSKNYFARLKNSIGKKQHTYREMDWMNTNKLMWRRGYIGGKTGQTVGAGSCLATIYQFEGKRYFIIVLGCQSRQDRFTQTQKLVNKIILQNQ